MALRIVLIRDHRPPGPQRLVCVQIELGPEPIYHVACCRADHVWHHEQVPSSLERELGWKAPHAKSAMKPERASRRAAAEERRQWMRGVVQDKRTPERSWRSCS